MAKHHSEYKSTYIEYEQAHAYVFPNQPFSKKEVGYLMSDLVRVIEQMLAYERLEGDLVQKNVYLLELFNERDLPKSFKKTLGDATKTVKKYPYKTTAYYNALYQLHLQENRFFTKQRKHIADESLQLALDHLDLFYLSEKFRIACEIINRQNMIRSEYHLDFIDELLEFIEDHPIAEEPAIAIYSTILKTMLDEFGLLTKKNGKNKQDLDGDKGIDQSFIKLIQLLENHASVFPQLEAREMFIHAINYCVRRIHANAKAHANEKQEGFVKQLFELYKLVIEKGLLFADGSISPWTYMNIVNVGIRNDEFEWTEKFIEEFKEYLRPQFKENAYNYNLAYFLFYRKDYDKAIKQLNQVIFDDVYYSCESKGLLLRIYYMTEELGPFYSLADSFRIYLRRNKLITESKKELYYNLIRFLNRLTKIIKGDNKSLSKLKNQINDTQKVINIKWLLDQVESKMV